MMMIMMMKILIIVNIVMIMVMLISSSFDQNLVTICNRKWLWGSAVYSLIEGLTKMLSKCKKIVCSLTRFRIKYKQIVALTTFTDSLKKLLQLFNQLSFGKLCLLFGLLASSFKYAKIW